MPSSIKMIKATNVVGGKKSVKIETEVNIPVYEVNPKNEETVGESIAEMELRTARKKAQEILAQAEQEKEALLAQTQAEIETLKQTAYEEAYQKGMETGQQEGFNQGYTEATQKATEENIQEKEKIQLMLEETLAEIDQYKYEKKEELIELASHMAAKIIHKEINASDKGILELAQPYFYQIDKDEELVSITVHPSQRELVEKHLPEIERMIPNTRLVIYGDPTIEENGLVMESSKAVIDLQVKKQIEAMLQEFDEMERTVDA